MAWLKVEIIEDSLVETTAKDGSVKASGEKTYYVEADAAITLDSALSATAGGVTVAARLEAFSATRPRCVCRSRRPERITPFSAQVKCSYEDPTDGDTEANMVTKAARISEGSEEFSESYNIDAEESPVINTAGEAFDQMPQRQRGVKVYTIKKFVNATVKGQIDAASNTNNAASKTINGTTWQIDELWLSKVSFEPIAGSSMWDATMVIKARRGGWASTPLNTGFRDIEGTPIKLRSLSGGGVEIDPVDGETPDHAWPLDADGYPKDPASDLTPDELVFYPYEQNAWTGVPLT